MIQVEGICGIGIRYMRYRRNVYVVLVLGICDTGRRYM